MAGNSPVKPALVIIVPCFNEAEAIPETAKTLSAKIRQLISGEMVSPESSLLFVDDGSTDESWSLIEKYQRKDPGVVSGIKLPENTGHQNALLCALLSVKNKAGLTVTIDADLQDDVDTIDKMIDCYYSGSEVVCGVRSDRKCDGLLKRISAWVFYRLMRFLGSGIIYNHADFRLMSGKAVSALAEYCRANGKNILLRCIIPALGLKTTVVHYKRKKRMSGKSKYTLWKMLKLAYNGLSSFAAVGKRRH